MSCNSFAGSSPWNRAIMPINPARSISFCKNGMEIVPVEAKGGMDKSAPSFKRYVAEHRPKNAIRFSTRGYRKDGAFTNVPLYLARKIKDLL